VQVAVTGTFFYTRKMCRGGMSSIAALVLMLGCSTVDVPSVYTDGNDETGPAIGEEPPIEPNDTVFSKIEYDENYSRIAVGNVARTVEDTGCCLDYVLAGPGADDVRVVFGGGKDTGLTFLDDRPDEVLALGPSDDVALVDLNEDGRNDLIALGEDHQLDVRLGVANPGPDGPFLAHNGVASPTTAVLAPSQTQGMGAGDLATGDVDADGHVDVVMAALQGGVVILWGHGDGAFEAVTGSFAETKQDLGPVRVLVTQLDGAGGDDVATANADGSFSVLLDAQGDRTFDDIQRHVLRPVADDPCPPNQTACRTETATAVIAAGPFCVSTPGIDLAYAYEDKVWIICGNDGNFAEVGEEPHGSGVGPGSPVADYRFDLNGPSTRYDGVIDDIFAVDDDIYVLRQPNMIAAHTFIAYAHRVIHLTIDHNALDQDKGEPVLELYASTARVVLHPASLDSSAMRLAWPALGLARWRSP
jgi:hypothetical protein